MSAAHVREVNYLSPSSLKLLEERPVEFYRRRLGPAEHAPKQEQTNYFDGGIAFDAVVKRGLAAELDLKCPSLAYMLDKVDERGRERGTWLHNEYALSGAYVQLLAEQPVMLDVTLEDFLPETRVPVKVKLDAVTKYCGQFTVHDWKTAGWNSPASPTKGYSCIWEGGKVGAGHDKQGQYLETLSTEWADQLGAYALMGGHNEGDAVVSVDEVVMRGDRVRVAQFRAKISEAYLFKIRARYVDAWRRIREQRVLPTEVAALSQEELALL